MSVEATSETPGPMNADEYAAWVVGRPGRYELRHGRVVRLQAERNEHNRVKTRISAAFTSALEGHPSGCTSYGDGASVRIYDDVVYEPDATITCGTFVADSIFASEPTVVVEVVSPSSVRKDTDVKFEGYFHVPSIHHFLVVNTQTKKIVHHRREGDGIRSGIYGLGTIRLDPPGIELDVDYVFRGL